ncbi:MAG: hypothetical protein HYZ28_18915 [Myxococcales bacterium]|nr:hypothetical protein [Myxococcales bacterium]
MPSKKDPKALRAKIERDPNTAKIAKELQIPVEEYVEMVLHYALNPNEEPELVMVKDEDLRAHGYKPPRMEDIVDYLKESAEISGVHERTDFKAAAKKKPPMPPAPELEQPEEAKKDRPELKKELRARRGGGSV